MSFRFYISALQASKCKPQPMTRHASYSCDVVVVCAHTSRVVCANVPVCACMSVRYVSRLAAL